MEVLLAQCTVNWIMTSLIYCLVALGMTLVFSIMGILNFAHGALYMLGGYVLYFIVTQFSLGYPLGFVLAFLLPGLLGLAVYKGLLRRFRADIFVCLIITVGLAGLFENGAYIAFNPYEKSVPSFTTGVIRLADLSLSLERLVVMFAALALTLALLFFIQRAKSGRALRAVAQDTEAAMLQGVSGENTFSLSMFLASGLAGIAGALMAPIFAVGPFSGQAPLINAFIVVVLGGLGSIPGAVVGSFMLGLVTSFGGTFLSGGIASMISFGLLFLILVFKPRGLLGGQ